MPRRIEAATKVLKRIAAWVATQGEEKVVKKKVAGRKDPPAFQSAKALHSPAAVVRLAALLQVVAQLAAELRTPGTRAG